MSEKLKFSYYGNSDIGLIRTDNQDSFGKFPKNNFDLYSEKGQLFIVADGMGGHVGGKEASSIAVDTIQEVFFSDSSDILSSLKKAIEKANSNIYEKSENSTQFRGMGTTCTVLALKENKGTIAHIGDSRIYMIENKSSKKIEQLTEDHTKVNEMLRGGLLTEEEAKAYPSKNVLARALGVNPEVKADFLNITIKNGQSFILCSDGLAKVTKNEILEVVAANSPEHSCDKLINLANERGGKDNVTVLIIKIGSDERAYPAQPKPSKERKKNYLLPILIILFFLLAAATGFFYKDYLIGLFKTGKIVDSANEKTTRRSNDKTVNSMETDSFNKLLAKADNLYKRGRFEEAFIIYKQILSKNPMHLGALEGMNNIASEYINKAERYKNQNNIQDALIYLKKALQIQPSNERLKKLIKECETKLNNQTQ